MDDASAANVTALELAADSMLAEPENQRSLAELCKKLTAGGSAHGA